MTERLMPFLLVGLGGFLGANARYLVARWADTAVGGRLPVGTLLVNVSGSFLLGLVGALVATKAFANADAVRLALGVGFLGAYTTFSTFELETHALLEDGLWMAAAANVALSVFLGLVAVRLGIVAARSLF